MSLFDKAIKGLTEGFDSIVYTTEQLMNMADNLEFGEGGVSDSDGEEVRVSLLERFPWDKQTTPPR